MKNNYLDEDFYIDVWLAHDWNHTGHQIQAIDRIINICYKLQEENNRYQSMFKVGGWVNELQKDWETLLQENEEWHEGCHEMERDRDGWREEYYKIKAQAEQAEKVCEEVRWWVTPMKELGFPPLYHQWNEDYTHCRDDCHACSLQKAFLSWNEVNER